MLRMKNIIELLRYNYLNHPQKIFLNDDEVSLSYEQAYREVIRRASILFDMGLKKSPILVKVNRKADTLINFFAILLSNNYFIPVDEDIPNEKLAKIIKASKAEYYISTLIDDLDIKKIDLSTQVKEVDYLNFELDFDENNYSYLIFTSGSTGEPKGVIKNHKNIIAFVNNFIDTFPFLSEERIANQTPFYFDASMKDIFLVLKLGATLFIPNKTIFALPSETVKYLNEKEITYICWVPSILTMIAKTRTLSYLKPAYLRYIYFVGEVFQVKYLNMWIEALPHIRYFNLYGSSEVMGVCLYHEIKGIYDREVLPLGQPIKNNQVTLVDNEIFIKSDQVALGYINSDNSHFSNGGYYSGDYAKYDEDGDIVFTSRKDYQIKHLGYRIELQEIEAALTNLEYIDSCCAIYDDTNDKIILFAVTNRELDNPSKSIISDAKEKLQFYMIPNKVKILSEMPFNSNGKIDRVKLKGLC